MLATCAKQRNDNAMIDHQGCSALEGTLSQSLLRKEFLQSAKDNR